MTEEGLAQYERIAIDIASRIAEGKIIEAENNRAAKQGGGMERIYAFSMVSWAYDKGPQDDAGKYKADRSDH